MRAVARPLGAIESSMSWLTGDLRSPVSQETVVPNRVDPRRVAPNRVDRAALIDTVHFNRRGYRMATCQSSRANRVSSVFLDWAVLSLIVIVIVIESVKAFEAAEVIPEKRSQEAQPAGDVVRIELETYTRAVAALRADKSASETARDEFHREWMSRLLNVALSNPDSEHCITALGKSLGMANSLGEFRVSEEIVNRLLQVKQDVRSRIRWLRELGSVRMFEYRSQHDPETRREAIDNFETANELIRSIDGEIDSSGPPRNRQLTEDLILHLNWLGELYQGERSGTRSAAIAYREARKLLESSGIESRGRMTGYDIEHCASEEMTASINESDFEQAFQALEVLAEKGERWPGSFYVRRFAEQRDPARGPVYRDTLERWLKGHAEDSGTAFLIYDLAESYFRAKEFRKAYAHLRVLKNEHAQTVLAADNAHGVLAKENGGFYAGVLYQLAVCAMSLDRDQEALESLEQFCGMYRHDPRYHEAKLRIEELKNRRGKGGSQMTHVPEKTSRSRWMVWLNVSVVCVLLVVGAWRRNVAKG